MKTLTILFLLIITSIGAYSQRVMRINFLSKGQFIDNTWTWSEEFPANGSIVINTETTILYRGDKTLVNKMLAIVDTKETTSYTMFNVKMMADNGGVIYMILYAYKDNGTDIVTFIGDDVGVRFYCKEL